MMNRITAFAGVCLVPAGTMVLATIVATATWSSQAQSPSDTVERRDNPPLAVPATPGPAIEAVAPFAATPMVVVDEMLKLARVGPNDFVVDLGSGDGRLVLTAVTKFGARGGFGVDIDASLVDYANRKAMEAGVYERARFHVRDLFVTDIHEATVVTVYLLPIAMNRLQAKLLAELAPGSRVVSHDYPFRSWRRGSRGGARRAGKKRLHRPPQHGDLPVHGAGARAAPGSVSRTHEPAGPPQGRRRERAARTNFNERYAAGRASRTARIAARPRCGGHHRRHRDRRWNLPDAGAGRRCRRRRGMDARDVARGRRDLVHRRVVLRGARVDIPARRRRLSLSHPRIRARRELSVRLGARDRHQPGLHCAARIRVRRLSVAPAAPRPAFGGAYGRRCCR